MMLDGEALACYGYEDEVRLILSVHKFLWLYP